MFILNIDFRGCLFVWLFIYLFWMVQLSKIFSAFALRVLPFKYQGLKYRKHPHIASMNIDWSHSTTAPWFQMPVLVTAGCILRIFIHPCSLFCNNHWGKVCLQLTKEEEKKKVEVLTWESHSLEMCSALWRLWRGHTRWTFPILLILVLYSSNR